MNTKTLSERHLQMLREESGISAEVIRARGYRTVTDSAELKALDFAPKQRRVPGLLLPLHTTDGNGTLPVYRPDNPRVIEHRRKGKQPDGTYPCTVIRYEVPKGSSTRLDCSPTCQAKLADPSIPLWITEGQKKADSLASRGLCAIALLGVWNWRGKNDVGGTTFLADWDYVALDGRDVRIVFDSDTMKKHEVRQALERLTEHLQRRKAHVAAVYLPAGPDGKVGVDDWLVSGHTAEDLEELVEAPRPEPRAAEPIAELLEAAPPIMRRPLALVKGQAHAAIWPYVKTTITEGEGKNGEIIRYNPPRVLTRQSLHIVRDDGVIFGPGGDEALDDLGFEVHLSEIPPTNKLWTTVGVKRFAAGYGPDPLDVFSRVVSVVDRFIDFNRSLATQEAMCEMVGCYILATWFLDAFNAIGYLWSSGDKGSGKTQLIALIAELGYLGQLILARGSYAALRDLADYGATLAFDDAENLTDRRQSDPDKLALLLAGYRRGSTVPLKEPTSDRTWRVRHVNTFCPRLFSAIRQPYDVLSSRTIIVPLVRTIDREKGNAVMQDFEGYWPCDRDELIDDLWALAVSRLSELAGYEKRVGKEASLVGRNLEPWRAILAVAMWLNERGKAGLWERMEALSVAYQEERPDLEYGNLAALVIRTLVHCVEEEVKARDISDTSDISDIKREIPQSWFFKTSRICDAAKAIAEEEELSINTEGITSKKVGRALGQMRLENGRVPGTGARGWAIALSDLQRLTIAYGFPLPAGISELNVTNVTHVTNVTGNDETTDTAPEEREIFLI